MNILPKKSWHVRSRRNVERTRRDQEQAAAQDRQGQQRAALAEQEARTEFLRSKSRRALPEAQSKTLLPASCDGSSQNFNLFRELEEGKKLKTGSKEYEAEKRQEKERQERAVGLLTYLGQSSSEAQTNKPWYQEGRGRGAGSPGPEKDARLKRTLDPLVAVNEFLRRGAKAHRRRVGGAGLAGRVPAEGLRAERLRREASERRRAECLLAGLAGEEEQEGEEQPEADDRRRRYNSQFHPHLGRKPRGRERH